MMHFLFAFWFVFFPWFGTPMLVDPGLEHGAAEWSWGLGNWGDGVVQRTPLAARSGKYGLRCVVGDPYHLGRAEVSRRTESADTPAGRYTASLWYRGRGRALVETRATHNDWVEVDSREVVLSPWWQHALLAVTLPEGGTPVYVRITLIDARRGDWIDVDDWQVYGQGWGGVL
jgi:hypothetical protein